MLTTVERRVIINIYFIFRGVEVAISYENRTSRKMSDWSNLHVLI